jgi:hypothetical protein
MLLWCGNEAVHPEPALTTHNFFQNAHPAHKAEFSLCHVRFGSKADICDV